MSTSADRNLLFGIVALQFDFITREQLIAGMSAWVLAKHRPLADILQEAGALSPSRRQMLEPLVEEHVQQHNNDPQQSLAAVSSIGSVKEQLQSINDAEVQASLPIVAANRKHEPENFATMSAGQPTSAGLRFRVLRPHAKGGLGVVRVAQDEELAREVALKEILPEFASDQQSRGRFVREAEITGGLEHPGIVPVYGLGSYPDGRPFYAMRFIKGDSLAEAIKEFHADGKNPYVDTEKNLQLRKLLQRFIDVCEAMEYAHSRGVLHRDLKPGNIMLGKYGETLVVDWGLAKSADDKTLEETLPLGADSLLRPRSRDASDATQHGAALGTPAYMPPEQAEGRLDLLGPASDVYSLGATLYAILSKQAPVQGTSSEEVLSNVRRGKVLPLCQVSPQVPRALAAICTKALALQREDRYSTARELAADVERYLADEPVTAYPEPVTVKLKRWGRKHPAIVASSGATLLVTLLAATIGWWVVNGKNAELAKRTKEAQEQAEIATAVKDFLLNDLLGLATAEKQAEVGIQMDPETKVRDLLLRADEKLVGKFPDQPAAKIEVMEVLQAALRATKPDLKIRELVVKATEKINIRFADQPLTEAEIRSTVGKALSGLGLHSLALMEQERSFDIHQEHLGINNPITLRSMNELARAYVGARRNDEALALFEKNRELRFIILGPEHPDTLGSMHNLATAYATVGRKIEALSLCEQTLKLRTKMLGPEHPDTLHSMNNLANAYAGVGRNDDALALYEQALKLKTEILGREHPATLASMGNLASAYAGVGRNDDALALYEQLPKVLAKILGPEHPVTLGSLHNLRLLNKRLGDEFLEQQEYAEAEAAYREVIRLDPNDYNSQLRLGIVLNRLQKFGEAEQAYCQAIMIAPQQSAAHINLALNLKDQGKSHELVNVYREITQRKPDDAGLRVRLGTALKDQSALKEALTEYRTAVQLDSQNTEARFNQGLLERDAGDLNLAVECFRKCIEIDPKFARAYLDLGIVLHRQGKFQSAHEAITKALELFPPDDKLRSFANNSLQRSAGVLPHESRLAEVLSGTCPPKSATEALLMADLCREHLKNYAQAVTLFEQAFREDPNLADDLKRNARFSAAIAAVRASEGNDVLAEDQQQYRRKAWNWLNADLVAYANHRADQSSDENRSFVGNRLAAWKTELDLRSVRDVADALPDSERGDWRMLWSKVDAELAAQPQL